MANVTAIETQEETLISVTVLYICSMAGSAYPSPNQGLTRHDRLLVRQGGYLRPLQQNFQHVPRWASRASSCLSGLCLIRLPDGDRLSTPRKKYDKG